MAKGLDKKKEAKKVIKNIRKYHNESPSEVIPIKKPFK